MRDVIFHNISINIIITLTLSLSIGQHRIRFHLTSNALGSASANYCTQRCSVHDETNFIW